MISYYSLNTIQGVSFMGIHKKVRPSQVHRRCNVERKEFCGVRNGDSDESGRRPGQSSHDWEEIRRNKLDEERVGLCGGSTQSAEEILKYVSAKPQDSWHFVFLFVAALGLFRKWTSTTSDVPLSTRQIQQPGPRPYTSKIDILVTALGFFLMRLSSAGGQRYRSQTVVWVVGWFKHWILNIQIFLPTLTNSAVAPPRGPVVEKCALKCPLGSQNMC